MALLAVSAVSFAIVERPSASGAISDLRGARPAWVLAAVALAGASLVVLAIVQQRAQRVAGLESSLRELLRPTLHAHALNSVSKSAGLAGVVALTRHAETKHQPRGKTVAAYLLADVAEQVSFLVVVGAAFGMLAASRQITGSELVTGVLFTAYIGGAIVILATTFRSREATRRLFTLPARMRVRVPWARFPWARTGSAPNVESAPPVHDGADELYDAISTMRASPGRSLSVVLVAIVADLVLVGLLMVCLRAVGASVSLGVVFVVFAMSTLFGIVGVLPGGVGFVEVSAGAALVAHGVRLDQATAAVGLYRLGELYLPLGLAVLTSRQPIRGWRALIRAAATSLCVGMGGAALFSAGNAGHAESRRTDPDGVEWCPPR